jgi:hypothetical protein
MSETITKPKTLGWTTVNHELKFMDGNSFSNEALYLFWGKDRDAKLDAEEWFNKEILPQPTRLFDVFMYTRQGQLTEDRGPGWYSEFTSEPLTNELGEVAP